MVNPWDSANASNSSTASFLSNNMSGQSFDTAKHGTSITKEHNPKHDQDPSAQYKSDSTPGTGITNGLSKDSANFQLPGHTIWLWRHKKGSTTNDTAPLLRSHITSTPTNTTNQPI